MKSPDVREALLLALADHEEEVATRPEPAQRDGRAKVQLSLEREWGPRYSPDWLAAVTVTEAGRQRVVRTIRALSANGMLTIYTGPGGRMTNLKLTAPGLAAVERLRRFSYPTP